jgi:hypothetical protein
MSGVRPEANLGELFQYTRELAYKLESSAGEILFLCREYEPRNEASSNRGKHGLALKKYLTQLEESLAAQ